MMEENMIDPGELILGAYVIFEDVSIADVIKVDEWIFGDDYYLKYIEPIPLTEQWLIDLGFEYDEETGIWSQLFNLEKIDWCMDIEDKTKHCDYYVWNCRKIEYIHQLQGLVKFLTGKLLTKYHE